MNWYIRKQDGGIYGPVPLDALQQWAADGRVAPDDELSLDQQSWQPAPELSDLGMDWLVQMNGSGSYGPVHILALAESVRDGSLPPQTPLTHKRTGEVRSAGELLLDVFLSTAPAQPPAADVPQAIPLLPVAGADKSAQEIIDSLVQNFSVLSRNYDKLLAQLQQKTGALQDEVALRHRVQAEAEQAIQSARDLLRAEQEKSRQVRDQLAEVEAAHFALVKDFREMNDRYIRLRQATVAASARTDSKAATTPAAKHPERPARS